MAVLQVVSTAQVHAAGAQRFRLVIPAQPMPQSLNALAMAIGAQTLFPFEAMSRLKGPALDGEYTAVEALQALLADTGYRGRINEKGVIVVRAHGATDSAQLEEAQMMKKKNYQEKTAGTGGILLSALSTLFGPEALSQADTSQEPRVIEEVLVTATRRETGVQSTALSVSAISGQDLVNNAYTSVGQFLDAVPGVTAFNEGPSRNRVIIRNIATSTQEEGGATTATYFDDFVISGVTASAPTLKLVDINRVEVLKGPQGTLFGRSAMGGIIRYMSNKPDFARVAGGINGYFSQTRDGGDNFGGHGYLNIPIGEALAVRAVAYSYQHDGWIDNLELGAANINEEDTVGGRLALRWTPTDRSTIDLTYITQDMTTGGNWTTTLRSPPDDRAGVVTVADPDSRQAIGGVIQRDQSDYDIFNLDAEYRFDTFSAKLLATRSREKSSFVFDQREFVGITNGCVCDGVEGPTGREVDTDILEARLVSSGDQRLDWIVGAYYEDTDLVGTQNITYLGSGDLLFGAIPVPQATGRLAIDTVFEEPSAERAVYGELTWAFSDRTRATVGYRRSDVQYALTFTQTDGFFLVFDGTNELLGQTFSTQEDVDTYKLSLEHDLSDDLFLYATAASGYRRGGFNQPSALNEFSTFDSDSLWSYELGIKSTWMDGRLLANAAAFFLDWNDMQLVVQDPVTFNRITQNVGKAYIPGIEFNVSAVLGAGFDVTVAGSLTRPELQDDVPGGASGREGDTLPGAAEENFSVSVNWERESGSGQGLFASALYRYVGDRLNDFNRQLDVALPSYQTLDLRAGYASPQGFSLALFAHNLFDEAATFVIDRQGPSFEQIPTNPPRTIGLNMTYDF